MTSHIQHTGRHISRIRFFKQAILLTAALPALFLSGCEQELNLDPYKNPEIENMLVVNSILNPDSLIGVSVTHPYFFSDKHLKFTPVSGLDVRVAGKDGKWLPMRYDGAIGLYRADVRPEEGERYAVRVIGEGSEANTCDTIPQKVAIQDIKATGKGPMHIYWDTDYRFTYKITFQDTPGQDNYYFLAIEDDAEQYEFSDMGQVDYTVDYVFQVLANSINNGLQGWQPSGVFGYPFSDKDIDGQRYTLTVSEVLQTPLVSMIKRLPRKVHLYAISRSYFEYMTSVLAMDYEENAFQGDLLTLGLMEPHKIFSNIEGGTGLMGCYSLYTAHVDLLQMTGGWPTN